MFLTNQLNCKANINSISPFIVHIGKVFEKPDGIRKISEKDPHSAQVTGNRERLTSILTEMVAKERSGLNETIRKHIAPN